MATQIEIRPIAASDEAEWRDLWTGYLEFYESSVSEDVYRTTFARLTGPHAEDELSFEHYHAVEICIYSTRATIQSLADAEYFCGGHRAA